MSTKKYWKGLPELTQSEEFINKQQNEFAENLPIEEVLSNKAEKNEETSRRDFLKIVGFTTAAAALASCETPVIKSIPYVVKPEEVTPGVANFYASTFYDGHDYAPILVKTREGRPIKIEGNDRASMTNGGTSARIQASVLSLYDSARLSGPIANGNDSSWSEVDKAIGSTLNNIKSTGKKVALVSSTIISPSTLSVIENFKSAYPGLVDHIIYDSISYSALRFANNTVFGKNVLASYNFQNAEVIVGIACDFLGTWLNPVEFASQYSSNRKVSKETLKMSKHYHFESNLSLTGANADERYPVKPSDFGKIAVALYNAVASKVGVSGSGNVSISSPEAAKAIQKIADKLVAGKGKSLVVCGINDNSTQVVVASINKMLENYGNTLNIDTPLLLKQGDDKSVMDFVKNLKAGQYAGVMFHNVNPAYTLPASLGGGEGFKNQIKNLALSVSFSQYYDETAQACKFVCPDHNYLESWGDANPKKGVFTLQQPAITPLFGTKKYVDGGRGTRQFQDTLLKWSGSKSDYYSYLQAYWQNHVFPMYGKGDFWSFWSNTLSDGYLSLNNVADAPIVALVMSDSTGMPKVNNVVFNMDSASKPKLVVPVKQDKQTEEKKNETTSTEGGELNISNHLTAAASQKSAAWEVCIYEKVSLGNGNQSNNPWLHELPDPITKVTWDNYITINPADAGSDALKFNLMLRQDRMGSYATVNVNGVSTILPVFSMPGQASGTIGIAVGYGRVVGRKSGEKEINNFAVANGVGQNAFPMLTATADNILNISSNVTLQKADGEHLFAGTQIQHTIMGREDQILRETKLDIYKNQNRLEFNPPVVLPTHEGDKPINEVDLWDAHPRYGHKWAMNIDLNSCIGCGACVIACQTENNVAVVGKEEVSRSRDMAWLRIDRYFTSDMNKEIAEEKGLGAIDMYLQMENPSNNPKVTFQPLMCQHCNHAPCETVCPVLATNHSSEGLNQMAYNRCIGTRYCANNCPFKVRRFNWWNYNENPKFSTNPSQTDLGRMVLNPDVVVRSRGVMEKCSMCQQRLQAGKTAAKKAGMPLKDGLVKTACQQACPTKAITFGDANDTEAAISKARNDDRNYYLLEELGVKPNISYMVKVRNEDVTASDKKEAEYRVNRYGKKAAAHSEEKTEKKTS
ncbi:MAG: TAT-variant-translocated molybdopterin oxidoreductase [Bacteroidota bacterium]|jgi:MoCo/4Fe-4S cofactor protein with predicted Tat translocation signal